MIKVLDSINHKLHKIPAKGTKYPEQIEVMYWNLWRQFGVTEKLLKTKSYNVKNFIWLSEAKKEFYKFPLHKKLIKDINKKNKLKDWVKICEPVKIKLK